MKVGCLGLAAKLCLIGLAALLVVNIVWVLISPLLPTASSKESGPAKPLPGSERAKKELPAISTDDMAKADTSVQEINRRVAFPDGAYFYALAVTQIVEDGRPELVATVERQAGDGVFWTAISRTHSRIEVTGADDTAVALNPIRIEGAVDLDTQVAEWGATPARDAAKRLDAMPAERRDIALKPKVLRLIYRAPEGFSLKAGGWARLVLTGWTNKTLEADSWQPVSAGVKSFAGGWTADLFIPNEAGR